MPVSRVKYKYGHQLMPVVAKTADYTITSNDFGTLFTNTGAAGAVNFTLPSASAAFVGCWVDVAVTADQNVTITAGTADTLIVYNDLAADSIAWSTAGQLIGNSARLICVSSTKWFVRLNPATTGAAQTTATVTIAT